MDSNNKSHNFSELFTVREVAQAAKQAPVTIYRHIEKGAIKARKVGGSVRITREAAEEYLGEASQRLKSSE